MIRATSIAALLLLAFAPYAFAWNGEAHQLVAYIAEERLGEKARSRRRGLLGDAQLSDAEVVSWADEIRRERRESALWHLCEHPDSRRRLRRRT